MLRKVRNTDLHTDFFNGVSQMLGKGHCTDLIQEAALHIPEITSTMHLNANHF